MVLSGNIQKAFDVFLKMRREAQNAGKSPASLATDFTLLLKVGFLPIGVFVIELTSLSLSFVLLIGGTIKFG